MTRIDATHRSSADVQQQLDGLIARYSVLGAERRRKRRRAWLGRGIFAISAVGAAAAAALADWQLPTLRPALEELRAMQSTLATEIEGIHASRAELEQQRAWLEQQSAALASRLLEFDRRAAALEAESEGLRAQTARLEAALARADEERQALLAAASRLPSQLEVESIEEQQRELEERRAASVAHQSEVSSKIDLLSQRRQELEERRVALEARRRELEALLGDGGRGAQSGAPVMGAVGGEWARAEVSAAGALAGRETDEAAAFEPSALADFAIASSLSPESLDDMRGGILLGEGMNVAIGLTRSASINGVEQITNSFTLDGLNRSLGALSMQSFEPVVIQNGPGNMIDSSLIDGVPGWTGTIIQNTLDDQIINLDTTFDVSISDVSKAMDGVAAGQALRDSLYFQQ